MTRINDSFLGHTVRTANTAGRLAPHRRGFAPGPVARSGDSDQQPHGGLHASPPYAPIDLPPPLPLARAAPRSESGPPPPPQPERPLDRGRAERGWGGHRGDPRAPPPSRLGSLTRISGGRWQESHSAAGRVQCSETSAAMLHAQARSYYLSIFFICYHYYYTMMM